MMKFTKYLFLLLLIFNVACDEGNGCIKRITVPDNVNKTSAGFEFEPSYLIDVLCDFDETTELLTSEVLKNFSYEIVSFNFTPDTGNNTSKLQFKIVLKNNNTFDVEGLPIFLMRADGVEFSANYSGNSNNCSSISSNGTCTINYAKETSLETEKIKSLELVSVKFLLPK